MRPYALRAVGVALVVVAGCGPGSPDAPPPEDAFELRLTVVGPGSVDVHGGERCAAACKYAVPNGGAVTLTAVPNDGAAFQGWGGACSGSGTCTVDLTADVEVTAAFGVAPPADPPPGDPPPTEPPPPPPPPPPPAKVEVEIERAGEGEGRVTSAPPAIDCGEVCRAELDAGTSLTLTAAPAPGSTFAGWSGACSGTGTCALTLAEGKKARATARFDRAAPAHAYTVTEIPHPPGDLVLEDFNEDGDALGTYRPAGGEPRPLLYDGATGTIRLLADVGGIHGAWAMAMNDAGAIVAKDMAWKGPLIRWEAGVQTVIEVPGAELFAHAIGNQGWIVGSLLREGEPGVAFLWDGVAVRELGTLGEHGCSATAVNGGGDIVGGCDGRAVRWVDGKPLDLGLEPHASVTDLTENRLVAGGAARRTKVDLHAFIADLATGSITRVPPPEGRFGVTFEAVNARGDAIARVGFDPSDPMLWSGGAFTPLRELSGLDLQDVLIRGFNDRGQIALLWFDGARWRNVILTPRR